MVKHLKYKSTQPYYKPEWSPCSKMSVMGVEDMLRALLVLLSLAVNKSSGQGGNSIDFGLGTITGTTSLLGTTGNHFGQVW